MVYNKNDAQLEDKFFFVIYLNNFENDMLPITEEGENKWVTENEFRKVTPFLHNELDTLDWYLEGFSGFKEERYFIDEY